MHNRHGGFVESDSAISVTELSHGEKGEILERWYDVGMGSFEWEAWDVKVAFMCGVHDRAIWILNGDRISCGKFVRKWEVRTDKMAGAAGVGNGGNSRGGGRTYVGDFG